MRCLVRYGLTAVLAALLLGGVPGCGANLQFGIMLTEDLFGDVDVGFVIRDGYWRDDYVYYRGRWYLHGYGTPYYDGWYAPW